ncbi:MAG: GNAT family N-acetyltransferase [Lachnospiraceae bacterium]|nr:GNAT family N-acetyltransferase [Lachnospiraceae bacterium]
MESRIINRDEMEKFGAFLSAAVKPRQGIICGVLEDEEPVGAAVLDLFDEGSAVLLWIYVDEKQRQRGYAGNLLEFITDLADQRGMVIQSTYAADDLLNYVLHSAGFDLSRKRVPVYEMSVDALHVKMEEYAARMTEKSEYRSVSLKEANDIQLNNLLGAFSTMGVDLEDLRESNLELSQILVKDNRVEGALLVKRSSLKNVEISFLQSIAKESSAVLKLMTGALKAAEAAPIVPKLVRFTGASESVVKFAESLNVEYDRKYIEATQAVYFPNEK